MQRRVISGFKYFFINLEISLLKIEWAEHKYWEMKNMKKQYIKKFTLIEKEHFLK